ncbi:MAG: CRISPR-associated endonuclease Cas2 [Epsilonproteobacteria bacterium]|nr:CRISPR-associated endonuclease Cas2 [Campylobacterota bacterium]NPA56914.1 CRISPR-associated endonuclease Cas2 [Campylobacterota bacterium]
MRKSRIVIAYDISDEQRLQRVAHFLENYGIRVQRSIFELEMVYKDAVRVLQKVEDFMDKEEDRCYLFRVSAKEDIVGSTQLERIF